ncbi:MAG: hypothetical protein HOV94_41220 [Saccharothrix sp.]|nr:hypothetical protein [Saccharothrix sp.]
MPLRRGPTGDTGHGDIPSADGTPWLNGVFAEAFGRIHNVDPADVLAEMDQKPADTDSTE